MTVKTKTTLKAAACVFFILLVFVLTVNSDLANPVAVLGALCGLAMAAYSATSSSDYWKSCSPEPVQPMVKQPSRHRIKPIFKTLACLILGYVIHLLIIESYRREPSDGIQLCIFILVQVLGFPLLWRFLSFFRKTVSER